MSAPLPDVSVCSPVDERELDKLARKWAQLVSGTAYIPLPHREIVREMRELAHEVFEVVAAESFEAERAAAVGERLVRLHCVGKTSLRCSVEVLAGALLAHERLRRVGGLGERVARALSVVACGYAESVRWATVEEQEGLNQALLTAMHGSERRLKDSQARCDEAVTELSLLRNQLSHQLLHDVLTALPNQGFFTTRLEQVLNTGGPTTVYQLELNGLDAMTVGLGRRARAHLRKLFAGRLTGVVAEEHAMVAHVADGRFAILVESTAPAPDPAPVIKAINTALAEPAHVNGHAVVMSANIGVVQSPPYRPDPDALLHAADLALYAAKLMGPGRWTLLDPAPDAGHQELRLAATLPDAWCDGRVHVEFRPQIRLADHEPVRLDTRVRWDHDELGALSHQRCVALAEQIGFGERLGRWLLDHTARRVRSRPGEPPLTLDLPPSLATHPELPAAVDLADLPARRLQISVPAGLATSGAAARNLTRLATAGVEVAVHDFGGAAGDVTCLADLPVHAVRLAPDLTRRKAEPVIARALRDMITLIHEISATVIVDGLTSRADADWWRDAGADLGAGPLFTLPTVH